MDQKLIKKEPLGKGYYVNVTPHHTFGTDAVVLRHFANPKKRDKLVDLGTGCGIIPLLMLRDNSVKEAVGVDISTEATDLAQMTVEELGVENFKIISFKLKYKKFQKCSFKLNCVRNSHKFYGTLPRTSLELFP